MAIEITPRCSSTRCAVRRVRPGVWESTLRDGMDLESTSQFRGRLFGPDPALHQVHQSHRLVFRKSAQERFWEVAKSCSPPSWLVAVAGQYEPASAASGIISLRSRPSGVDRPPGKFSRRRRRPSRTWMPSTCSWCPKTSAIRRDEHFAPQREPSGSIATNLRPINSRSTCTL